MSESERIEAAARARLIEAVERKLSSRKLAEEHPGAWDDAEDEYCDEMILQAARELAAAADGVQPDSGENDALRDRIEELTMELARLRDGVQTEPAPNEPRCPECDGGWGTNKLGSRVPYCPPWCSLQGAGRAVSET